MPTTYHCEICTTDADSQKSHHTSHKRTKKHKDKKRIVELELEKMTEDELQEKYAQIDRSIILNGLETVVTTTVIPPPVVEKKTLREDIIWELADDCDQNPQYKAVKAKLDAVVKKCHDML